MDCNVKMCHFKLAVVLIFYLFFDLSEQNGSDRQQTKVTAVLGLDPKHLPLITFKTTVVHCGY